MTKENIVESFVKHVTASDQITHAAVNLGNLEKPKEEVRENSQAEELSEEVADDVSCGTCSEGGGTADILSAISKFSSLSSVNKISY